MARILILNRQKVFSPNLSSLRIFVRRLRAALRLAGSDFNVCLVTDREIRRLNDAHRGKPRATDVLSFPWHTSVRRRERGRGRGEFRNFLGDVVISVETARRNARQEGHSTTNEIRWLILHGVLHLLAFDHETDRGEMIALENSLREKLRIAGEGAGKKKKARRKTRISYG